MCLANTALIIHSISIKGEFIYSLYFKVGKELRSSDLPRVTFQRYCWIPFPQTPEPLSYSLLIESWSFKSLPGPQGILHPLMMPLRFPVPTVCKLSAKAAKAEADANPQPDHINILAPSQLSHCHIVKDSQKVRLSLNHSTKAAAEK